MYEWNQYQFHVEFYDHPARWRVISGRLHTQRQNPRLNISRDEKTAAAPFCNVIKPAQHLYSIPDTHIQEDSEKNAGNTSRLSHLFEK
jgi:hypothetical protein